MTRVAVPYHLDEYLPDIDLPVGVDTRIIAELPDGDTWSRMVCLYDQVAVTVTGIARRGGHPVVMSGDCTTALGVVAGLQLAGLDPAIVWFDAHGDVQTLETTTSGYLGGMPLRMLVGYRPELMARPLGLRPVAERRVALVDARDLDPPELSYLEQSEIRRLRVEDVTADMLPDGPIYLHVDTDVVDPAELPGLRFPAADGPGLDAVAAALHRVHDTGRVAALGLACTWHAGNGAADVVRPLVESLVEDWG